MKSYKQIIAGTLTALTLFSSSCKQVKEADEQELKNLKRYEHIIKNEEKTIDNIIDDLKKVSKLLSKCEFNTVKDLHHTHKRIKKSRKVLNDIKSNYKEYKNYALYIKNSTSKAYAVKFQNLIDIAENDINSINDKSIIRINEINKNAIWNK